MGWMTISVIELPVLRGRGIDARRRRVGKQAGNVGRRDDLDEMARLDVVHLDEGRLECDDVWVVQG